MKMTPGRMNAAVFASGKKKRKELTPPRSLDVGCSAKKVLSTSNTQKENLPRMSLSSNFLDIREPTEKVTHKLRTSESDPSEFQLELPTLKDVKLHANICSLMDKYIELGGINFDFSLLMYGGQRSRNNDTTGSNPIWNQEEEKDLEKKKQIVLQELSKIQEDLIVQGFFREYVLDKDKFGGLGRVEACIFSSDVLRKIIVCFRGSNDLQHKPVSSNGQQKLAYKQKEKVEGRGSRDGQDNINNNVRVALSANDLDQNVYTLLQRLSNLKPFHDIVILGHTFGAALATAAAQRLAVKKPMMRIYCQVFGSPRVGGDQFRQITHSLPNLNVSSL